MVLAHHLILSAYGFWLPNDPRGSCSTFVGSEELFRFGKATTVDTHHSVAAKPHDRQLRRAAKSALKRRPVRFTGVQARAIGRGFAATTAKHKLRVWACAIMPDHAHLVIGANSRSIERIAAMLKADATRQLLHEQIHPFAPSRIKSEALPTIWAVGNWRVYLSTVSEIRSRIRYVEDNPIKAGFKRQRWAFVTCCDL